MQHLLVEHRVALIDLARQQGVSVSTVWRWKMRGLKGTRLETFTVGGRRYTSREAFSRIIGAVRARQCQTARAAFC
jgi:hypothetical protein